MKKHLLSALGFFCIASNITAQEERPANLRHPCNTVEAMEEGFLANPQLKAQFEASQAQFQIEYEKAIQEKANNKNAKVAIPTYTIPVVFHIMGPQSITDQVFENLVTYFNRDFAMAGSDTTSINPAFKNIFSDSGIRFALAKRDPNGNCTNGIIRHNSDNIFWSQSSPAYNYSGTGTNRWPTNKYLNIYIVECISSMTYTCPTTGGAYIGGYTYLPGSTPYTSNGNMGDAIVLLKNQLAQGNPLDSRTISHEIGHWLNLLHTFGSSNNPKFNSPSDPGPSSCSSDQVSDTPPTGGYFSFCPAASTYTRDCSNLPNYENIMDYASCPKMFTDGQITRMTTALNSSTGGRNNLWTASNYTATGISSAFTCSPVANFISNKSNACTGATVTYTSTSYVGNSGSVSWVFQGGTPSTSTSTLQVVSYPTPGTYSVSITATNSTGSNVKNATSYVNVVNGTGGSQVPLVADFEGSTLPSSITVTNANTGSPGWIQHASNGANSTSKSIYINNASSSSTGGHIDYFETPIYDFTGTTGITLSYYYAYAKRTATQADTFKVQYSLDCGGVWSNVLGIPNTAAMATASGGTTTVAFTPTSSQWIYKNIVSSLLNTLNNKPSVKFRFWFKSDMVVGRSNNIYIDQININGNVVTGITELEKSMQMVIYPNPTSSSSNIEFTLSENQSAKISVVDLMGRTLEETSKTAGNNGLINYTINANNQLAAGVYFVNIDVNNQRISKKLIIE